VSNRYSLWRKASGTPVFYHHTTGLLYVTPETAARVATHMAELDTSNRWHRMTLADQNNATAHYLEQVRDLIDRTPNTAKEVA